MQLGDSFTLQKGVGQTGKWAFLWVFVSMKHVSKYLDDVISQTSCDSKEDFLLNHLKTSRKSNEIPGLLTFLDLNLACEGPWAGLEN